MDQTLIIVNEYRLLAEASDFVAAITALAARVDREGERGVLSYRFHASSLEPAAAAVVHYRDPAAWIGHHETAMVWPEMAGLHRVAKLARVTALGPVTEAIHAWLARSGLVVEWRHFDIRAAGFDRF